MVRSWFSSRISGALVGASRRLLPRPGSCGDVLAWPQVLLNLGFQRGPFTHRWRKTS